MEGKTTRRPVFRWGRRLVAGSLRRQLLLAVVAVNGTVIAAVWGLLALWATERNRELQEIARRENRRQVERFRRYYLSFLQEVLPPAVSVPALIRWPGWRDMRYVQILQCDPSRVFVNPMGARARPPELDPRRLAEGLAAAWEENREFRDEHGGLFLPLRFARERPWGAVYVLPKPMPPPRLPPPPLVALLLLLGGGTLLMVTVTYGLLSRLVIAPLEGLVADARRLARGDYRTPTLDLPHRRDEVGRLSLAIAHLRRELAAYHEDMQGQVARALERVHTTERRLMIAQRLAATGKLAAGIAHELNNPVGGMLNMVRRLREGDLPSAKQRQYLDLIEASLGRMEKTLGHLLRCVPRREVELKPVALREPLEGALALVRHRAERQGVRLRTDLQPGLPRLLADVGALQQIFVNLFLNALDAMPAGGELRVKARARPDGRVEAVVADTGRGMTPGELEHAFDLFYTTKPVGEGSGLGLAIVHSLVEDLEGEVEVRSRPGRGTRFRLLFPAA